MFANLAAGARVVKAFNHLPPHLLSGDPRAEVEASVFYYAGDDARSKAEVGALIAKLGFTGIVSVRSRPGKLVQFPGGPLPELNLVKFG